LPRLISPARHPYTHTLVHSYTPVHSYSHTLTHIPSIAASYLASQADIADICRPYSLLCKQRCCRERPPIGESVLADMELSERRPAVFRGSRVGPVHADTPGRRPCSPPTETEDDAASGYPVHVRAGPACASRIRSCGCIRVDAPHLPRHRVSPYPATESRSKLGTARIRKPFISVEAAPAHRDYSVSAEVPAQSATLATRAGPTDAGFTGTLACSNSGWPTTRKRSTPPPTTAAATIATAGTTTTTITLAAEIATAALSATT
jgi:hypothetical protein